MHAAQVCLCARCACMLHMHTAQCMRAMCTQVASAAHELAAMPHWPMSARGVRTTGRAAADAEGAPPSTVSEAAVAGDKSKDEVSRLTSPSLGQMPDIESAGELSAETSGETGSDQRRGSAASVSWRHGSLVDTDRNICQTPGGTVQSDRHRHRSAAVAAEGAEGGQSAGTGDERRRGSACDIGHTGFSAGTAGVNEWI